MLPVAEALARITASNTPLEAEAVPLADAAGRVLAADVAARLTQPPFRSSAMDGYAVRKADLQTLPARLKLIGESAAGHPFSGQVRPGEAVRIFTGALVPAGADLVVIQENVTAVGAFAEVRELSAEDFIRPEGFDFTAGQTVLAAGRRLTARDLMLAAQANATLLAVTRRPLVAVLASGDELVEPGETPGAGQIVSSIPAGLAALICEAGAEPRLLGIARDTMASLAEKLGQVAGADILVTVGGASVGEHDLVRRALEEAGFAIAFHNVAMRPGKPLMFGARGPCRVLGLPGNPVSAMVTALIFLRPLIAALLGEAVAERHMTAPLSAALPPNGPRQVYMRARITADGAVEAFAAQDSSLITRLAAADCLIIRPPHAPAAPAGETVPILPLGA
jgi:molybdopterin molybdotransferase